jgi:hypothetical protein
VLLLEVEQRTRGIGECCRVQDLNAGVMFPIERGGGRRTACLCGIGRRIEPKAEVIELHGIGRYAGCCLRDDGGRFMKHVGRGCLWDARGNNESLDIEPADEIPDALAGRIGINVADIPGEPERRVRNLNREQVEVGVRRQAINDDLEIFEFPEGMIGDVRIRLGQAGFRTRRHGQIELDSRRVRVCSATDAAAIDSRM